MFQSGLECTAVEKKNVQICINPIEKFPSLNASSLSSQNKFLLRVLCNIGVRIRIENGYLQLPFLLESKLSG